MCSCSGLHFVHLVPILTLFVRRLEFVKGVRLRLYGVEEGRGRRLRVLNKRRPAGKVQGEAAGVQILALWALREVREGDRRSGRFRLGELDRLPLFLIMLSRRCRINTL